MASTEDRLEALERAVAQLAARAADGAAAPIPAAPIPAAPTESTAAGGDFWLLDELLRRYPSGALAYGGHVELSAGPVRWQLGALPSDLLDADWEEPAHRLAALAHPVRLRLVQLVLSGVSTSAQLVEDGGLGTTGQLHHHLRQLVAAGWLASAGRGRYAVPARRVIPLLLIVAAAGE